MGRRRRTWAEPDDLAIRREGPNPEHLAAHLDPAECAEAPDVQEPLVGQRAEVQADVEVRAARPSVCGGPSSRSIRSASRTDRGCRSTRGEIAVLKAASRLRRSACRPAPARQADSVVPRPSLLPPASCFCLLSSGFCLLLPDRPVDPLVPRAPADVAGQPRAHVLERRARPKRGGRHDHARRAEAALGPAGPGEGALQRVAALQALDREHLRPRCMGRPAPGTS